MNMELFMKAYNSIDGVMTMKDVGDHSARRVDESIATNPDFFYGPYNGLLVRNAAYAFGGRLLSNHSREFPYGGRLGSFALLSLLRSRLTSMSLLRQRDIQELLGRI